ncbi:DNA replication regulator [Wickerhamomyces ciferrii]|uniref:DNA replication regulator SLD2 n=1 Tax=Wickerhamomyces ciferrii (strain ATCC 14091 / BCRC 22168 / CBS 111 / JCM 3599 / NBRC 0793 / NRRL Y-1031 F-60-10) TaxID=1206466 RepID=K0KJX4_WICCF|nr:DNA replication regulator [Wickerhamomyces ciferrii]CCH45560.1 DNA replication regulator [Wickerhamomyces ciferrii]
MSTLETEIKLELKAWEYGFKKQNGRNPDKDDIKKNPEICKVKVIPQFHTPHKTSSPMKEPETPLDVDELGPTPQMNGRVLGLFEVITSPKTTPQAQTTVKKENITLTPAKKTLDFSKAVDMEDEEEEEEQNFNDDFKTPQKPKVSPVNNIQQTPAYLKPGGSKDITASPSPLASQRIRKGLSTIINEFRDIQAELKYGDFDEDELDIGPLADIDEEGEENEEEEDENQPKRVYKKKKTQKRTTRRYVIKSRPNTDQDLMNGKDIRAEMEKIEKTKNEEVESEESEEWSDGPDEFIPKARSVEDGQKRVAQGNNFKRLKIRDKAGSKRNFGRRSRGY